ncbi:MAG: D-ribose ABC transporter substrate-binding protein [Phycisphaerae bacterium]
MALLAAGCGETEQSGQARTLKVAVIPKATNHEYWKAIHAGALKAEGELSGVQIIWKGPPREDDRDGQISTVENFVNAGVQGMVVAPLDETALVRPIASATEAGIPVVIMDSGLKAEPGRDYVSYVATDNEAGGRKAAQRMGELLGGRGRVLVLRYQVGSASTTQREDGFLDELKQTYPDIQVVSADQYAGATTDEAYKKAENLLAKYPDLAGIFGACEPVVFGILRALPADRLGQVKLVGFDRSEKLVQAMQAGHVHGLVLQDPMNMGYLAVKTLVAHLRGQQVAPRIDTGSRVATPENMNDPAVRELLSPAVEKYLP